MLKKRYIGIMLVLFLGLIVSGCTDNVATESGTSTDDTTDENISIAEETLNEELVGITDTEIQDIEEEIAEIDSLINETNETSDNDIVVEEI